MRKNVASIVLFAAALCACQKYVFIVQTEGTVQATQAEITISTPAQSDILFVMDNSGSMAEEQANVKQNVIQLITLLKESGNQFRIGLVTTDNQSQPTATGCDSPSPLPAATDSVHHGRCGRLIAPAGRPAYLDHDKFSTAAAMASEFGTYVDLLSTEGSAWEEPMKSVYFSLDPALTAQGKPNEGFFRDDALLVIVLITDESDCSFEDTPEARANFVDLTFGLKCYQRAGELVAPSEWASRIVQRKKVGRPDFVRVGLISGAVKDANGNLTPSACVIKNDDASNECQCFFQNASDYCAFTPAGAISFAGNCGAPRTCCTALANDRLTAFANSFINLRDTICKPSYAETLKRLADLADPQCFSLEKAPADNDPANIQLKITRAGKTTPELVPLTPKDDPKDGWYYTSVPLPSVCLSGSYKRKKDDTISLFIVDTVAGDNSKPVTR